MNSITLCLAGGVMTGRRLGQAMAHRVRPRLYEPWVKDVRTYVRLAERVHGAVPAPVDAACIWGAALAEIAQRQPDVRLVNLETAITQGGRPWAAKGIHYRMHPANVDCLRAAGIGCCALANNHVLDWGVEGLQDSLHALGEAGIASAAYFARLSAASGALQQLEIVPMRLQRFQLTPADAAAQEHLRQLFNAAQVPWSSRVQVRDDGRWLLDWWPPDGASQAPGEGG